MPQPIASDNVRATFLDFFVEKSHLLIANASLVPSADPTLLFINSGMAPLKAYFTGQATPPSKELCNVQPCLRTKDIDDVGDRHHLTFFEMLGSWSIGGYFKQQAIELAYELLTDRYKLDSDRLLVSVFTGNDELGLPADEESITLWQAVGIPPARIVALPMADNFWGPAGDTGPCGPCTEVFYDFGPGYGEAHVPGQPFETSGRYIEIWNAGVFMQFDKKRDGSFEPLPFFSVDTGAGLERLTMALNEQSTVYDIDSLAPLVATAQAQLGETGEVLDRHRLLADHLRAATFILAEGVRPSNEGRGYVPRRLIRKAIAVAHRHGARAFDVTEVADVAIRLLSPHYTMLAERRDEVLKMLSTEATEFTLAMGRGLARLEELLDGDGDGEVSGAEAFRLFSTYGLPFEITRDLATERGIAVDEDAYRIEFRHHQETSRATGDTLERLSPTDPLPDLPLPGENQFVGYEVLSGPAHVVAIFVRGLPVAHADAGEEVELLLDSTPFYGESGGQIGDRGVITGDVPLHVDVVDTVKHAKGYHVHRGRVEAGVLRVGEAVQTVVDEAARQRTEANHSATHLLNEALRSILGAHVRQAGSLVEPDRLRFDFTNPGPLTAEQLTRIERRVNDHVLQQLPRTVHALPLVEAMQTGATYLANEEYTSPVRVVSFGDVSVEFCGGTHVLNTSAIGLFKLVGEQSVASGVRRIHAVTREKALDLMLDRERLLADSAAAAKVGPLALPQRVEQLIQAAKGAGPRAEGGGGGDLALQVDVSGPVPVASALVDEQADARTLAIEQAEALGAVVALAGPAKGRSRVVVAVPSAHQSHVDARAVLTELLAPIDGRGGGSSRLAQGGGELMNDFSDLLARARTVIGNAVGQGAE